MEKASFARYFRAGADFTNGQGVIEPGVVAYLCEVSRLDAPQEANRNPTWFSVERAKQRLIKDRALEFGTELARVIDRAVSRIRRLHSELRCRDRGHIDGLQGVRFEAAAYYPGRELAADDRHEAALGRYFLRRPARQLGTGIDAEAEGARNVTSIERGRRVQHNLRRKP
jgi:hypothetical protein